jgi:hypothetical protein
MFNRNRSPAALPQATTHISCTRQGNVDRKTLHSTGKEQSRYTSITRGKRPVNAKEPSDARRNLWLVKIVISSHVNPISSHVGPIAFHPITLPSLSTFSDVHNDTNTPKHQNIRQDEALQHLRIRRRVSQSLAQDPQPQAQRARKSLRAMLGSPSQPPSRIEEQVERNSVHVLHNRDQRGRLQKSSPRRNQVSVCR